MQVEPDEQSHTELVGLLAEAGSDDSVNVVWIVMTGLRHIWTVYSVLRSLIESRVK